MVRKESNRLIIQSKCSVCGSNQSTFVKEQEAKGLLRDLGIKTALIKYFDKISASLNKPSGSGIVNESIYQLAN